MYDTLVDGMTSQGWSNDSASPDGYAAYVNYGGSPPRTAAAARVANSQ